MATYIISDIHGCFDTFQAILNKVNFSNNDKLYILGDIIDRGPKSYEMYQWVKNRYNKNVFMILGNHEELFNENILDIQKTPKYNTISEEQKTKYFKDTLEILSRFGNDQYGTIGDLLQTHSANDILEMFDFFSNLPLYYEINVNNTIWTLVHASCTLPLEKTSKNTFIWDRDLTTPGIGIKGKNIIFGHTPTICEEYNFEGGIQYEEGYILKEKYVKINIDCGCVWKDKNSKLGILRLDDMNDFYQDNID